MAGKRKTKSGKWEFIIKRAGLLEKPLYLTFDTEEAGDTYCARIEALLDRGIVPSECQTDQRIITVAHLVREYEREAHPSHKDSAALRTVIKARGTTPLGNINSAWVDEWISEMKRLDRLAPATIRAKVGALARCTDWGMRKTYLTLPDHPFRTLPDGYAQYTKSDAALAGGPRHDIERDRRLEPGEFEKILEVLQSGVLHRTQRSRKLEHVAALRCMFIVAVESALRLREAYTLSIDQVDIKRRTIFLDKTKNGDKRQVPLSSRALSEIENYLRVRTIPVNHRPDLLYPWWNGDNSQKTLHALTDYLSKLYADIFEAAGCLDLRYHDLRHEAVSRLFEKTTMSEAQIMKISGHKSHRMLMRYANLRGSDLADFLP